MAIDRTGKEKCSQCKCWRESSSFYRNNRLYKSCDGCYEYHKEYKEKRLQYLIENGGGGERVVEVGVSEDKVNQLVGLYKQLQQKYDRLEQNYKKLDSEYDDVVNDLDEIEEKYEVLERNFDERVREKVAGETRESPVQDVEDLLSRPHPLFAGRLG